MGSLFYERAFILDLGFFYYASALPKALLKLALICDSASPFIDSHASWLPKVKSTLEVVAIREVLLSLTVLEEVLEVAFIFLTFFG